MDISEHLCFAPWTERRGSERERERAREGRREREGEREGVRERAGERERANERRRGMLSLEHVGLLVCVSVLASRRCARSESLPP